MKYFTSFLLWVLFFGLMSCDNSKPYKKENEVKIISEKIKHIKEKTIIKEWDTINSDNAKEFLIKFGKENKETKVLIKTDFGNIKLKLYNDTPLHRASFIFLIKAGYFDNTVFYRVVENFVIQGGDSEDFKKSKVRYKYENYRIEPEFRKKRRHKYGALAAAREWEFNPKKLSTAFEFYIVQNRKGAHHLNNEHTVFGEVISGFSTIDKIAKVKVGPGEWPIDDLVMKIEVIE